MATDYEYYYNNARSRYSNACSEINSCENRVNDLEDQRKQKINLINKLKTDIKDTQTALDGMIGIIKSDESLNSKIVEVSGKTDRASANYGGMVNSSDVTNRNLTDVYSDETAKTKTTLNKVLTSLKAKKTNLETKLADLKNQLKRAESDLQDIENRIKSTQANIQELKSRKSSASYDMEYYRRKMSEEAAV
jgi:predicted  nucleic acid-binding Zn-ribbon protein